jgi:hypothetical protein
MILMFIRKDERTAFGLSCGIAALAAIVSRLVMIMVCPSLNTLPIHSVEESKPIGVLAYVRRYKRIDFLIGGIE